MSHDSERVVAHDNDRLATHGDEVGGAVDRGAWMAMVGSLDGRGSGGEMLTEGVSAALITAGMGTSLSAFMDASDPAHWL